MADVSMVAVDMPVSYTHLDVYKRQGIVRLMACQLEVIDGDALDVDLELELLAGLVGARDLILDLAHRRRGARERLGLAIGREQRLLAREQLEHAIDAFEVRGSQALVHLVVSYGLLDDVPLVQ